MVQPAGAKQPQSAKSAERLGAIMNAFIKFNRGILKMPSPWKAWLMLLVAANMVVPLFYIKRPEAQIIVITLLASMACRIHRARQ